MGDAYTGSTPVNTGVCHMSFLMILQEEYPAVLIPTMMAIPTRMVIFWPLGNPCFGGVWYCPAHSPCLSRRSLLLSSDSSRPYMRSALGLQHSFNVRQMCRHTLSGGNPQPNLSAFCIIDLRTPQAFSCNSVIFSLGGTPAAPCPVSFSSLPDQQVYRLSARPSAGQLVVAISPNSLVWLHGCNLPTPPPSLVLSRPPTSCPSVTSSRLC